MKIYHKKNFAVGLSFTALGLAFLGLELVCEHHYGRRM